MTGSSDLKALLESVAPPAFGGYSTVTVPGHDGYRVGRGKEGSVVLLTPPDVDPDPPTRLRLVQLDPKIRCRVEGPKGVGHEADYGVVDFRPEDDGMLDAFLAVAGALVRLLGPDPAPGQVSRGMRRLVKLFELDRQPRGSVIGLWGELFVIASSTDPGRMVDAWHASVDDRFDLADQGSRLEVKTTTSNARVHEFNLNQLQPVGGVDTHVASVMTTETRLGTSVGQMVERVEQLVLGHPDRQMKVHEQVAEILGPDWFRRAGRRFDEAQASGSLAVLECEAVPRVADPPPDVLKVRLTVDCSDVPHVSPSQGLGALVPQP